MLDMEWKGAGRGGKGPTMGEKGVRRCFDMG